MTRALDALQGDVSRRVNGERLVVLGWGRAVLMQCAHPLIAQALHEHSVFRNGAADRLRRAHGTIRAMLDLSFGSTDAAARTIARINAIHDRVAGRLDRPIGAFPTGARYSAHDPELLGWVHTTLIQSNLMTYARLVGPLTRREEDAYCAAAASGMTAVGLDPQTTPASRDAVDARIEHVLSSGVLAVGHAAHATAAHILAPPGAWAAPPLSTFNWRLTVGLLPPIVRELYGLDWTDRDERSLDRWTAWVTCVRRASPGVIARWRPARSSNHAEPAVADVSAS